METLCQVFRDLAKPISPPSPRDFPVWKSHCPWWVRRTVHSEYPPAKPSPKIKDYLTLNCIDISHDFEEQDQITQKYKLEQKQAEHKIQALLQLKHRT